MKNLLLSSIFFTISFLLTSCGAESVSSLVTPPKLSVEASAGREGSNITFTVSLNKTSAKNVTFRYRTEIGTGDTAQQADFTEIAETKGTISIGETTTTIEVMANSDTEDDDNETFSLVLSAVSGAVFSPAGVTLIARGTITDDGVLVVVLPTLSVGAGTGGEATGEVVFTVSLSKVSADVTTFKYRTEIGTGYTAQQADFTAIGAVGAETDGMIPAGSSTVNIVVAITEDTEDDDNETFGLVLSAVSGAVFLPVGTTLTAIGTITDNDDAVPLPTLSIGAGTGGEGSSVIFTVSLSEASAEAVTFKYRTEVGTGDTADQADFTAIAETDGTIEAGNTTLDLVVVITDDIEDDDDETFSLVLSDVSGAVLSSARTITVIGTITDNDPPMLSVGAGTGNEGGSVSFTVSLSSTVGSDVTFKYRTEIGTSDTADQADFTAIGAVGTELDGTITAGSSTASIVVTIASDDLVEGDNTFSLVLIDVSGVVFAGGGTTLIATGTITDDDVADSNGNGLLDIANAAELANIRYNLAGTSYKTSETDTGDSSYCPATGCNGYELVDNIDLVSVTNWTPIQGQADTTIATSDDCVDDNSGIWDGTGCLLPTAFFSAIFDGNSTSGNTISNLAISSSANSLGLFGVVSGTLKNLKLKDGSITGLSTSSTTAGALAGRLISSGIIEASSANLAVSVVGVGSYTGGLVGLSSGTVMGSYSDGDITGGPSGRVGGLVGLSVGTILGSYATGVVTGGTGSGGRVGGLVGLGEGTVRDSYATGDITGGAGRFNYLGGLAGIFDGTVLDSYATGDITGGVNDDRLGGLVGRSDGGTIRDSYATGTITGGGGADYLGGLVGWLNETGSTIQNSNATGDVTGGAGEDYLGGLVGLNVGTIEDSNAIGVVTGAGAGGGDFVGGLVGFNNGSDSVVRNSYATGAVAGGDGQFNYVGGLAGFSSGTVRSSYATGAVTSSGSSDRLGGLAGRSNGTIQKSNATGSVTSSGSVGGDYMGGLVGWSRGGSIIQNSNATGAVTSGAVTSGAVSSYLGGLVGISEGSVYDSYAALGAVTGGAGNDSVGGLVGWLSGSSSLIQNSNATGVVAGEAGNDFAGGLVGQTDGNIRNGNATGVVAGGAGDDYVGGLVGFSDGIIQDSNATGAVTGAVIDANTGAIIGTDGGIDDVGGLVGLIFESGITRNSYATGAVTGSDDDDNDLGGLVGYIYSGTILDSYATGTVTGGAGDYDYVGGLVGRSGVDSVIRKSYALGAVIGGVGVGDYVGRIVGFVIGTADIFGNYYTNTVDGEIKRTILTDEAVEKDVGELKGLTATTTQTDFTSTDATDGWLTDSWDFTTGKYPSLKSYKVDGSGAQVEGDLLCTQGTDWVQC